MGSRAVPKRLRRTLPQPAATGTVGDAWPSASVCATALRPQRKRNSNSANDSDGHSRPRRARALPKCRSEGPLGSRGKSGHSRDRDAERSMAASSRARKAFPEDVFCCCCCCCCRCYCCLGKVGRFSECCEEAGKDAVLVPVSCGFVHPRPRALTHPYGTSGLANTRETGPYKGGGRQNKFDCLRVQLGVCPLFCLLLLFFACFCFGRFGWCDAPEPGAPENQTGKTGARVLARAVRDEPVPVPKRAPPSQSVTSRFIHRCEVRNNRPALVLVSVLPCVLPQQPSDSNAFSRLRILVYTLDGVQASHRKRNKEL